MAKKVWAKKKIQTYNIPTKPKELIEFLKAELLEIPISYRNTAVIEIEDEESWENCHNVWLEIRWLRPETAAERRTRLEANKTRAQKDLERDKREYARLQKIFGSGK